MIEIKTVAWIGGSVITFFAFVFIYLIQVRINNFKQEKISPLPLEGILTVGSYCSVLAGFTIMFTAALEIFTFSFFHSLIASFLLAFATGAPMWKVVIAFLREVESGELKEIVPESKINF